MSDISDFKYGFVELIPVCPSLKVPPINQKMIVDSPIAGDENGIDGFLLWSVVALEIFLIIFHFPIVVSGAGICWLGGESQRPYGKRLLEKLNHCNMIILLLCIDQISMKPMNKFPPKKKV